MIRQDARTPLARVPVGREHSQRVSGKGVSSTAGHGERLPHVIRWSFLLFVMSFPFEAIDLGFSGSLSLARIIGLPFFASYFFYYNPLSKKGPLPHVPHAMWWFLGYVIVYAFNGFFIPEQFAAEFQTRLLTLIQLIVFFWIASNLLENEKLATAALVGFGAASVIVAVGTIFELPGFAATPVLPGQVEREAALGFNPNSQAELMALATVGIVGLLLARKFNGFTRNGCLAAMTLPLLIALVQTGSRSGIIAFMLGLSVYLLDIWNPKRIFKGAMLIAGGIAMVAYVTYRNPDFLERWEVAYYDENLAGREKITPTAIEMISERPLFGWKPVEFTNELGARLNSESGKKDTHNLFLYLLAEVGAVGAIPFFVGFFLCAVAAWKARGRYLGWVPAALILTLLATNMAGSGIIKKALWFTFALTTAAGSVSARGRAKRKEHFRSSRTTEPVILPETI
jgi:O-antigen ligase